MIVSIDSSGAVSLVAPEVFTEFSVRVPGGDPVAAAHALQLAEIGGPIADSDEVAVSTEWVTQQVLAARVRDGVDQLEGMLGYARSKGWVDDAAGTIRSHVEEG